MRVVFFHQKTGLEAHTSREGSLFLRLFEKDSAGKFRLKEGITVNLSPQELGELGLLLFTCKGSAKFIHKVNDTTKTINFESFTEENNKSGIRVSIQSGDRKLFFALTKGEAYILWRLANHAIDTALKLEAERRTTPTETAEEVAPDEAQTNQPTQPEDNRGRGRRRKGNQQPTEDTEFPF